MKILIAIITLLLFNINAFSQGGVNFESLTFEEALAKAKVEKKLVFMDCYTSWCGPCKYMAEKIFPLEKAGEFFNPKFISVKFNMEKGEGVELAKRFGIASYPTFLIFRPNGTIQHKVVGGDELDVFITRIQRGLDENTALGNLEKIHATGKINKKDLIAYQVALIEAYEKNKVIQVGEELDAIITDKDRIQKEYWPILKEKTYGTADFKCVLNNISTFYKRMGKECVDSYLHATFLQTINNTLRPKAKDPIELLKQMRNELVNIPLKNKENLIHAIDLNQACLNRDIEQAVAIAKTHTTNEDGEVWQTTSALNVARVNATKEDLKKIISLEDTFIRVFEGCEAYLKNYFEELRRLAYTGVYFEDLSYQDALKKARLLGQKVFINCYTTNSETCENMNKNVCSEEKVGDFLNRYFVCIKIDMKKEGSVEFMKAFDIQAFPTFIILDNDDTLIHKFVGSYDKETFIKKIQEGLDDNKK